MPSVGQLNTLITQSSLQSMSSTKTFLIVDEGTNVFPPDEDDIAHVFKPLRHMCHGKVVMLKEAVIDDSDIVKGIVEYAQRNRVNTIVVGAPHSSRNTLARTLNLRSGSKKFKGHHDVSTGVMKSAPDYSSVYVISKGKIVGARPAIRPMINVVPSQKENGVRTYSHRRGSTNGRSERSALLEMPRCSSAGQTMNQRSLFSHTSGYSDSSGSHKFESADGNKQDCDLGSTSDSQFLGDMEAEMRMLRLKLKQTMDMYNSTCKDVILAQTKGPVFRGQLDHTPVAIKILNPDASHGRRQFQQEVEILCSIRHPNMVLLLGACPEYGCLVYEYLENGSLEDRLLMKNDSPPIPWWKRFEIAAEIATALLFLHQTKPEPIVHRDLKPANILLDKNFVSKISDVGLARLVPPSVADSVTQYHLTAAAGTFCYIDPEYQQTGKLTKKSDIYSLGIMLLQIITAKPPMGLAHHVRMAIEKETFSEMLDIMISDVPLEEALAFVKLSLSCTELSKKDRPDLATVVVPELNRLRDFGLAFQNRSHPPHLPTPTRSPRSST
ncbi:hypothetical protein GYH30_039651 [Glycine max]|nr:hypothetical protein GYH30_039651 [Glycine max]